MGGDAWAARTAAVEGSFFRTEQAIAMRKHMEQMIKDGKLPEQSTRPTPGSVSKPPLLDFAPPTEYRTLPEYKMKFQYRKTEFPALSRSPVHDWKLGTQVSFGPGRWNNGEASIWDVSSGKKLAQTPSKQATWAEEIRIKKIAKAQYESPLVAGYRLLPQFTPGKAFFWGTVLAVWGTAVGTTLASKSMGVNMGNAAERLREAGEPLKRNLKEQLDPLKESWSATSGSRQQAYKVHETPKIFQELKVMYGR